MEASGDGLVILTNATIGAILHEPIESARLAALASLEAQANR